MIIEFEGTQHQFPDDVTQDEIRQALSAHKPFGWGDTWPARLAKSVWSGLTLPGDVATGQFNVQPTTPGVLTEEDVARQRMNEAAAMARVPDLATIATPVNPAVRAGDFAIPGAAMRPQVQAAPAAQAARAAENIGVNLPMGIASDQPLVRFGGQVVARAPGGGPFQEAVRSSVQQTGEAVGRTAERAGTPDKLAAGQGFVEQIEGFFKPTLKANVSAAYDKLDTLVDPDLTVPLRATQRIAGDIEARRGAAALAPGRAVGLVEDAISRPEGLTVAGIKELRTTIGEMLDTGVFPEGVSEKELRSVYGALSADLKTAVRVAGGDQAVTQFERANRLAALGAEWKVQLRKVLGPQGRSGEAITDAIIRMARAGPGGDLKTLVAVRAAVPKETFQDIAATAIADLGRYKNGEWTPARFLSDYNSLSPRGKSLLFGDIGQRDLIPELNDIAKVSQKFVDAGKLANPSGTAGHGAAYALGGSAVAGILHGSMIEPLTVISSVIGINLTARVLANKATAAAAARWSRAYDAVAYRSTAAALASLNVASRNFAHTINKQLGVWIDPAALAAPQGGGGASDLSQQYEGTR